MDLRECNHMLEFAKATSDTGIFFSSSGVNWDDAVICTITDASFCKETKFENGETKDHFSQQGYIVTLASPTCLNEEVTHVHPIRWSSTRIKRVCRSTLMAETYSMSTGVEQGLRVRAAVCDMKLKLQHGDWETSSAENMAHVWITDCDSVYEHLISTRAKQVDNQRLGIDMAALRQIVWDRREGLDTTMADTTKGDYPRWIDTSAMLADPLTKVMSAEVLEQTMMSGVFDMTPTAESIIIKEKNRASRRKARDVRREGREAGADEVPGE